MVGESRFGGITRGGFFGLMLVGGLVLGLFFIPELLQLRSKDTVEVSGRADSQRAALDLDTSSETRTSSTSGEISRMSPAASVEEESFQDVATPESRGASSWGWWNDLKEWFAGLTSPRLAKVAREREASKQGGRDDTRASLSSVSQRLESGRPGQITWATIRSQESKEAVGQARRDAMELARGIPQSATASRFAMIDFANGLDFVMTKADQQMSARDAIIYLTKLDQSVSHALAEEKVDRVFLKRWSQISMGPVLGKTMLGQRHDEISAVFDPQLTMTAIQVRHKGMRRGDPSTGKVEVVISGYVIGDDIEKITMEANNGAITLPVYIKRDPRGFWFFNRGSIDGRKQWKFTVFDKFGEQYTKIYQFYPKASIFRYDSKLGYQFPFRMARATVGEFRSENFDPRLDKFFALSEHGDQAADPNALYSTF